LSSAPHFPSSSSALFGKLLPLPVVPALHASELALSFVYGLLTALAFGTVGRWRRLMTCRCGRCFAKRP